jgi:hypothetical protein
MTTGYNLAASLVRFTEECQEIKFGKINEHTEDYTLLVEQLTKINQFAAEANRQKAETSKNNGVPKISISGNDALQKLRAEVREIAFAHNEGQPVPYIQECQDEWNADAAVDALNHGLESLRKTLLHKLSPIQPEITQKWEELNRIISIAADTQKNHDDHVSRIIHKTSS